MQLGRVRHHHHCDSDDEFHVVNRNAVGNTVKGDPADIAEGTYHQRVSLVAKLNTEIED